MYDINSIQDKNNKNHFKANPIQIRNHYWDRTPGGKFINVEYTNHRTRRMEDAPLHDIVSWIDYEEVYATNFGALLTALEEANETEEKENAKKKAQEAEVNAIKQHEKKLAEERNKHLISNGPKGLEVLIANNNVNEDSGKSKGAIVVKVLKNSFENILSVQIQWEISGNPFVIELKDLINRVMSGKIHITNIEDLVNYSKVVSEKSREEYKNTLEDILSSL